MQVSKKGGGVDNAGLWLEYGISNMDRAWQLTSWKSLDSKTGRNEFESSKFATIDDLGILREIKFPEEAEGLELVSITSEIEDCLVF